MKKNALKGTILHTPSKDCFEIHEDAYLIWDGDTVLGIFDEIPTGEEVTVRDCKDRLIIPGMSDLHIHAPQYSFVGIAQNLEEVGITATMLTKCLRELEQDRFITRTQYNTIPPIVEYSLAERGKTLIPALESVYKWAEDQMK